MTVKEFYELNKNIVLTPEEAGVGFALSLVFAERFKGMEISSIQALKAADINYGSAEGENGWHPGAMLINGFKLQACVRKST